MKRGTAMDQGPRNHVTFVGVGFNTTEDGEEFINPGTFGKDVGEWLACELRGRGFTVDEEVGQEDFGWYITFTGTSGTEYDFCIGLYEHENEKWLGWAERSCGLLKTVFGRREKGIIKEDLLALDEILYASDRISDVKWHFKGDFMRGNEEVGSEQP